MPVKQPRVEAEMQRRYGYFRGEHPDRAKVRELLEVEPMARRLAVAEVQRDIAAARRKE